MSDPAHSTGLLVELCKAMRLQDVTSASLRAPADGVVEISVTMLVPRSAYKAALKAELEQAE